MEGIDEVELYRFADMGMVFDLPIEMNWDLRNPTHQIEYTVAVIKLWEERK